ncbi:hypothetical protein H0H92_004325 [Tricholoma furcatifolium]|nr:hypothetical protein H0H92_004325 [Tricholoma furcatifolium]
MAEESPYILEDRSGSLTLTDFDDLYDRVFFRIAKQPNGSTTNIYIMHIRGSPHRDSLPFTSRPSVSLEFGASQRLGTITFYRSPQPVAIQMQTYLKKTGIFGSSLIRKFTAFDGTQYQWSHRAVEGQEWTCTTSDDHLVAHFDVRPQYDPSVSGSYLTVYQYFFPLTLGLTTIVQELLATLTIMRHIEAHNL